MRWSETTAALAAAVWMTVGAGCVSGSATVGHDAKDDLVSCVGEAAGSLESTREAMTTTLSTYVELVEMKGEDPVLAFEDFADALEVSRERVNLALSQLDDMEAASETYFGRWEADQEQFKGEAMRKRAEERLQTVRLRFGAVRKAVDPARERAEAWLDELDDQMLFLKYDLSREAVAAVRADAQSISDNGRRLLDSLETAVKVSEKFVRSIENGSHLAGSGEDAQLGREGISQEQSAARPDSSEELDLSEVDWGDGGGDSRR